MNAPAAERLLKSSIPAIELAIPSNEPDPMRWEFSQLSSMKRMIEV
jgi:hypothetical protein